MTQPAQYRSRADAEVLAHVHHVVEGSNTSFLWAMRLLEKPRREAMYAIYCFCREVDDIADESAPPACKVARLQQWREEIELLFAGRPRSLTARGLAGPVAEFGMEKADFMALIDGMEMDAREDMRGPGMEQLELYCDRVACAVGRLSIRAFGESGPKARDLAYSLGQALQLTNILRDIAEDAGRGRLYLPKELLDRHGIRERDPETVLVHPALPQVCRDLAAVAKRRFAEAEEALADCNRHRVRPAIVMKEVYSRILDRLIAAGWHDIHARIGVPRAEKLWIALRHGLL